MFYDADNEEMDIASFNRFLAPSPLAIKELPGSSFYLPVRSGFSFSYSVLQAVPV